VRERIITRLCLRPLHPVYRLHREDPVPGCELEGKPSARTRDKEKWMKRLRTTLAATGLMAAALAAGVIAPSTASAHTLPSTGIIVDMADPTISSPDIAFGSHLVPKTVGKLISIKPNGKYTECSAAVVKSRTELTIYTAAHCVYTQIGDPTADNPNGPHHNFTFIPALHHLPDPYNPGITYAEAPFNIWMDSDVSVNPNWITNRQANNDYAFIEVEYSLPGGRTSIGSPDTKIQEMTGGNGLMVPASYVNDVDIWGYPGDVGLNEHPDYAQKETHAYTAFGNTFLAVSDPAPAALIPGMSGGPWVTESRSELMDHNHGMIIGATSGHSSQVAKSISARTNDGVHDLYHDHVDSQP